MLINDGGTDFRPPRHFASGNGPAWLTLVDLNLDGHVDIATADEDGDTMTILMNRSGD